jgi:hypothetical protein
MSHIKSSLAALALLGGFATAAQAQGVVPGGWAPQFGYQSFGGAGFIPGVTYGYSVPTVGPGVAAFGVFPYGGFSPYGQGFTPYGGGLGQPVYPAGLYGPTASGYAVNALDGLAGAIRQSVRPGRRR